MPDWKKKINNPGITNQTTFYGDIVNNFVDYFSQIDLSADNALGVVAVKTPTTYESLILSIFDSDKSNKIYFAVPNLSEDKTFNLPAITGTSDELMSKTAPQIVTGKTMDFSSSNTATGLPKSAIPSSIAYEDEDNSFGQHYFDLQTVSVAPSAPATNIRRLFVNTDGKISVRTSGGSIIDLEAGGQGATGGFAGGGTATFSGNGSTTTFNITHGITPQPDIATVDAANAVTNNAFPVTVVITSTQIQLTFRTAPVSGTNNVSVLWAAGFTNQAVTGFTPTSITTMTNKTLTNPVISTIINSGTITLPTTSDTLVGRVTTDTLTGKTLNATNNTITDTSIGVGDLFVGNGTKFVRKARGAALQVLRTNSAGTDLEWAGLDSEKTGKSTANGNASATVFTIAHGLGATPTYTMISVASSGSAVIAAKADSDSTNITVTFASAPSSGTNNVVIYWRVIA